MKLQKREGRIGTGWIVAIALVLGIVIGAVAQEIRFSGSLTFSQLESLIEAANLAADKSINDYSKEELVDFMLYGLSEGLDDDYACYFTAEELQAYNDQKQGIIRGGIGVVITLTEEGAQVTEVYEDSPAAKCGIKEGDVLLQVDGIDVTEKSLTELSELVGGEVGTELRLRMRRGNDELVFDLSRAEVITPMVKYRQIGTVTYIQYKSFNGNATEKFREALDFATDNGSTGIIIDLRDNLGGDLNTLAKTADMILPEGDIIYALDKNGNRISEKKSDAARIELPMVILTNGYSASASEAFTGAARDYGVAVTVGTKTYGKGIMQTTYPLANGGAFKLTTAKYYLPKGECIHQVGITPDYVVELPDGAESRPADMTDEQDTQLQKALEILAKN